MEKVSTDTTIAVYEFQCECYHDHRGSAWGNYCGRCGKKILRVAVGTKVVDFGRTFCPDCHELVLYPRADTSDIFAICYYYCPNCRRGYPESQMLELKRPSCQICGEELFPEHDKFCWGCGATMDDALTVPLSFGRNLVVALLTMIGTLSFLLWLIYTLTKIIFAEG